MQSTTANADVLSGIEAVATRSDQAQTFIRSRQVAAIYAQAPFALGGSLLAALIIVAVSITEVPTQRLITWMGLFLAVSIGRYALIRAFHRRGDALSDDQWLSWFVGTISMVGITWALAGIYLPVHGDMVLCALIALCICGLVGGAAGTFSVALNVVLAFSVAAIVPYGVYLIVSGGTGLVIGGTLFVFLGVMSVIAIRINRIAVNELTLQFDNARLIKELEASKNATDTLAGELDQRVAERTAELNTQIEARNTLQAQLEESEQQFRSTFEGAAIGMVVATPDGKTVAANRALCEMVGYGEAELLERDSSEFTHPDDRHLKTESMLAFAQGRADTYSVEKRYIHRDGHIIWGHQTLSLVRSSDGKARYVLVQLQDVTARRAAEDEQRRWQYILDSIDDPTAFVDTDYTYRAVNQAYPDYFGLSHDEIVGTPVEELLGSEYFAAYSKPNTDRALAGESSSQESWFDFPAAGRCYVEVRYNPFRDLDGKVTGVVFSCRDLTERRHVEEALQASESRADLALEAANLGWWDLDLETWKVNYGPRWTAMLGYDSKEMELPQSHWESLVHPEDKPRLMEQMREHLDGKLPYYHAEERMRAKSGEWVWIESHGRAIRDETGKAVRVVGAHRNISDHKAASSALHDSEARFRSAFNEAGVAMAIYDLDGRFLRVNTAMCELVGYSTDELLDRYGFSLLHPDELPAAKKNFGEFMRVLRDQQGSYSRETRYITKSGQTLWIHVTVAVVRDPTGMAVNLISQNQDVTAEKAAHEALVDLEAMIRAVHDVTRDHELTLEQKFERLLDAGREHLDLEMGLISHQDGGQNQVWQRQAPSGWPLSAGDQVPAELHNAAPAAADKVQIELSNATTADPIRSQALAIQTYVRAPITVQSEWFGTLSFCSFDARDRAFTDPEKELVALLASWVGQEIENDQIIRALAENEKLAATGRIASRVAHEINNPLAGIKNAFQLIKPAIDESHQYYPYVGRIDRELQRIADIVREMFALYRPGHQQRREIELPLLISDVVALLEPHSNEAQVQVAITPSPSIPQTVEVPDQAVRQVLFNVLRNAIDASPQAATVTIATQTDADMLTISVTDRGSGIAAEIGENIFEPFFTTKDAVTNHMGLGLSVSRNLMEEASGSLTFRSSVRNCETTFYLNAPLRLATSED